jgi:hypothetical protein
MIPFILAGLGGYLIGDSLNEQEFAKGGLTGFDVSSLDALEKIQYKDLTEKSKLSKEDALSIIINNVEGDYEQLSSKLSKIAKQLAELPKGQMTLFADGGMSKDTDVKHFKILRDFKREEYSIKYFDGRWFNIDKDGKRTIPRYHLALFTNKSDFENFKSKLISEGYKFMGEYRSSWNWKI